MTLDHPKVKKIIAQCERRVKKLTGNSAVLIMFYKKQDLIPFDNVVRAVCIATSKTYDQVLMHTRKQDIVVARQLICFYANYYSNISHVSLANKLGYKDHTTSVSGSKKIKDLIETGDPLVIKMVSIINKQLNIIA